jgi:hypothetical protein
MKIVADSEETTDAIPTAAEPTQAEAALPTATPEINHIAVAVHLSRRTYV